MATSFYIITSLHKTSDGTIREVEIAKETPKGLKHYLDRLENDSTCILYDIDTSEVNNGSKR